MLSVSLHLDNTVHSLRVMEQSVDTVCECMCVSDDVWLLYGRC